MSEVKLVAYTQGVEELKGYEPHDLIAYVARVSNPAGQTDDTMNRNFKLIKYLMDHHHWSPFEMASATLEINTTRDIARQILRHRSFSFQEFSQRYAKPTDLGFELKDARMQDTKNRQNSTTTEDADLKREWEFIQKDVLLKIEASYRWAIDKGIAKEQARAVLPEGMTKSRMYMAGTFRSWFHYIQLRSANGTQLEHQVIALQCVEALKPIFPLIESAITKS